MFVNTLPQAALDLDFTAGIPSGVTVDQSPAGYAFTSAGLLTSFSANAGRRTDKGILVEPAGANRQFWSFSLATGMSAANSTAAIDNSLTNPTGGTGGVTVFTEDNTTNVHSASFGMRDASGGGSKWNSVGFFVKRKPGSTRNFMIQIHTAGLVDAGMPFDLGTGTVDVNNAQALSGNYSNFGFGAAITALPDGWFLCEIWWIEISPGSQVILQTLSGTTRSYAGDGTSGLYLWGGSGESYYHRFRALPITTTTAAISRGADKIKFTVPTGVYQLKYTFDDNTTLTTNCVPGDMYIPWGLPRPYIKRIQGFRTTAPFPTLHATDKHADIVVSNGNLTATKSGVASTLAGIRAATSMATTFNGMCVYFEVTINAVGSSTAIGFGTMSSVLTGTSDTTTFWCRNSDGAIIYNNATTGTTGISGGFTTGDTLGVVLDLMNNVLWLTKDGTTWTASGDPVAVTGGYAPPVGFNMYTFTGVFPYFVLGNSAQVTVNFGASAFLYTKPKTATVWPQEIGKKRIWRIYSIDVKDTGSTTIGDWGIRTVQGGPTLTQPIAAPWGSVITSSTFESGGWRRYWAFDGHTSSGTLGWASAVPDNVWLGYDFGYGRDVDAVEMALQRRTDTTAPNVSDLLDFKIEWSSTGQDWNTALQVQGNVFTSQTETKVYKVK